MRAATMTTTITTTGTTTSTGPSPSAAPAGTDDPRPPQRFECDACEVQWRSFVTTCWCCGGPGSLLQATTSTRPVAAAAASREVPRRWGSDPRASAALGLPDPRARSGATH